ncbi:hypothetical protein BHE74_00053865, partial [Ensete ventricosum]
NGPRSSLGIGPGLDNAVGPHRELARRFAEGIGKLAGSTSRNHRKKTIGLTIRMSKATQLTGPWKRCSKQLQLEWTEKRDIILLNKKIYMGDDSTIHPKLNMNEGEANFDFEGTC